MFAYRQMTRAEARSFNTSALNDNTLNNNELEGDLPTLSELLYLRRGLTQAGGKLPLFDLDGQEIDIDVVKRCLTAGWAQPWFKNPLKPDWLVCKLTERGRQIASES